MKTLRVEIARPLDGTWDDLGVLLRTQRRIIGQLLRAGMDARIACGVVKAAAVKEVIAPDARGGSPAAIVYQAMKRELGRIQKGKWKPEQRPALELCGGMVSALGQKVVQEYGKRASYKGTDYPIPVRKQELKVIEHDGAVALDMLLVSGKHTRVVVRCGKGRDWTLLRSLVARELKYGDCKLVYDVDRRKWYALIAYEPVEAPPLTIDPSRAIIVHRGIKNALYLLSTTGQTRVESGAKLMAQLKQFEARIREARRVSGITLGQGARGHGKRRRYEHYETLSGKRDRICRTWCQQMGAFVVRSAREFGAALIVIEDYGGIEPSNDPTLRRLLVRFPMYQLKTAITEAVKTAGMTMQEVPAEYVSTTCPACGCQDARQHNRHTGVFHCEQCALERPADFVAALHMLRRSGADATIWNERMQQYERLRAAGKEVA